MTNKKVKKINNKTVIPVMFCFDNNYVIPASVAFLSLLEHVDKNYFYKFYVLHSDITDENQTKLKQTIEKFSEFSELEFIDMTHEFEDLWSTIGTKGHFSKEVMYKVLVASIFPQYEKIIVSDVDVVFLGDISDSYLSFDVNEDYYLAGVKPVGKVMSYMDNYRPVFTEEEIEKLGSFCGGYLVFNLNKLRQDNMEQKFIECFEENGNRLNQMEQDVLTLCCYPNIKYLPLAYVTCSYVWDMYQNDEDFCNDINYSEKELRDSIAHPIQLHYATSIKPWKNVDCTKSEEWFKYITKTPFLDRYLKELPNKIITPNNHNNKDLVLNRNGKLFRLLRYIKHNPLFFIDKAFYKKIQLKLRYRFNFLKRDKVLYIIDDVFPCELSPFRYEEYMTYFDNFKYVECLTTGYSLGALNEKRGIEYVIDKFINKYKKFIDRFYIIPFQSNDEWFRFNDSVNTCKSKLAVVTFLNNLENLCINNLDLLDNHKIPFILTLYPGGGFEMYNEVSDEKLKKVFSSDMFRKVIVTQGVIQQYLLDNKYCKEDDICFIPGIVTPKEMLNIEIENKNHYGLGKNKLDICFVAHKYTVDGADKGYDKFIEVAKKITKKYSNVYFHVVGSFDENVIDVEEIKDKITFYGTKGTDWFADFYADKDIILSPNIPFVLGKGAFDGFPTGACTEAMLNKVALFATDELKQNIYLKDNESYVLLKPTVDDIYKKLVYFYKNPEKLKNISEKGYKIINKNYSTEKQIGERIELIKSQFES